MTTKTLAAATLTSAVEALATDAFAGGGVNVSTAVKEYGLSRSVLYELMGAGLLPYAQVGRKRILPRKAIAGLLARAAVGFAACEK